MSDTDDDPGLSPMVGGAFYNLCLRAKLIDPSFGLLKRRVLAAILLAWLPLLVLSVIGGVAYGGAVQIPFLCDFAVHARLLIALPLLFHAEAIAHRMMMPVVRNFLATGLVAEAEKPRFLEIAASIGRLRHSKLIEGVLIVFVFVAGHALSQHLTSDMKSSFWALVPNQPEMTLSAAGRWYAYLSLPLFRFILLRWYFRIALWAFFLWKISRLKLNLLPAHSDGCAGLGFLGVAYLTQAPFLLAHGFVVSGRLANRIFYEGASLAQFKGTLAGLVVLLLIVTFGPLCVFVDRLFNAKISGGRTYGGLAARYMREFEQKWLGPAGSKESFLGSSDIQSLADISNSFAVVRNMRLFPFDKRKVLETVVVILAPVAPLLLTMIPLEELLRKLFEIMLG